MDPPAKRADARRDAAKETGRIEAFSDGVFAIAITLLVLNLHVPEVVNATDSDLVPSLLNQWPTYVAFVLSFVTILIMWVNHHALFNYIHHTDHVFLMLNGLLLLGITVVPFPTAILAQYFDRPGQHVAAVVYSATFTLIAVAFNLVWRYAAHKNRLLHPYLDVDKVAALTKGYRFGPLYYLAALVLGFFSAPASVAVCMLLATYFAVPHEWHRV